VALAGRSLTVITLSEITRSEVSTRVSERASVPCRSGPANRNQQYTLGATLSGGTRVYSTTVRVPAPGVGRRGAVAR
jgi:hypothetical protein